MHAETSPRACGLFLPGHEVHWIQARRSSLDQNDAPVPGRLLEANADGELCVDIAGVRHRYWHHQPERLVAIADGAHDRVEVQWRWRLLRVPNDDGAYLFCIGEVDDHRDCPAEPPHGDPFDLLIEAGGFTISGAEALARYGDL